MSWAQRLQRDWWRPALTPLTRALLPLTALYGGLSGLRRAAYRWGLRRPWHAAVPVVVVGNLIVGGAGKTPVVIALAQALRAAGWTPGVVSRGYGRRTDAQCAVERHSSAAAVGDEPLLIHLRTGAPVMVGRDRAAAAAALCAAHPEVDLLLSDDGLQHLRLGRDLQVMVFDERGAGNGRLLPAGPLREPLPHRLAPTDFALYNGDGPSTRLPGPPLQRRLAGAVPLAAWWRGEPATIDALHALRGEPVWACAGMAHPERFFRMLEAQGLRLQRLPLPDHHDFAVLPWPASAAQVVVTEKDAVKLRPDAVGTSQVWVVALDLRLPADFIAELQSALRALPPPPRHDR